MESGGQALPFRIASHDPLEKPTKKQKARAENGSMNGVIVLGASGDVAPSPVHRVVAGSWVSGIAEQPNCSCKEAWP